MTNADKTDGLHFDVILEGGPEKVADAVSNAKVWTRITVAPGQYKMAEGAKVKGSPLGPSAVIDVQAGVTWKGSLELPIR